MATKDEDFVTRIFVAKPTSRCCFSRPRDGLQNESVEVALGSPQSRGKACQSPATDSGEGIADIMALPEDETQWAPKRHVRHSFGNIRRNELSDFVQINRGGKIAMKPDEDERIIGVETCGTTMMYCLTTSDGRAIRFPVEAVRVFRSRIRPACAASSWPRCRSDIMAILRHSDATPAERNTYLRQAAAIRRAAAEEGDTDVEEVAIDEEDGEETTALSAERYAELGAAEQFILTISANGYGKRSSAYEYRVSGRGGKGIIAMTLTERNGDLLAAFPVEDSDQVMLVSDNGTLIRCPVDDVRIAGRNTQGVTIFKTEEDASVVSVARLGETSDDDDGDGTGEEASGETGNESNDAGEPQAGDE